MTLFVIASCLPIMSFTHIVGRTFLVCSQNFEAPDDSQEILGFRLRFLSDLKFSQISWDSLKVLESGSSRYFERQYCSHGQSGSLQRTASLLTDCSGEEVEEEDEEEPEEEEEEAAKLPLFLTPLFKLMCCTKQKLEAH